MICVLRLQHIARGERTLVRVRVRLNFSGNAVPFLAKVFCFSLPDRLSLMGSQARSRSRWIQRY